MAIFSQIWVLIILFFILLKRGLAQSSDEYAEPESTYLFLDSQVIDLETLRVPAETLVTLQISNSIITWLNENEPVVFPNLRTLSLSDSRINPHGLTLGDSLFELFIQNSTMTSGTVENLLEKVTNLESLIISDVDELAMKSLPTKNLRNLEIRHCKLVWSSEDEPIIFPKLEQVEIYESHLNPYSITFSDALRDLRIESSIMTNGCTGDLLTTAINLDGLRIVDMNFQLDYLPTSRLRNLQLVNCTVIWEKTEPVSLRELEALIVAESRINPKSMTFSDQLTQLEIETSVLTKGTISDLLKTASNNKKRHINELIIRDIKDINVKSLPVKNLQELEFGNNCSVTWNEDDEPVFLPNLKKFTIEDCQINPHSITFSEKLTHFTIIHPSFVSGNLTDLFETTTSLKNLDLRNVDLDISTLASRVQSLKFMKLTSVKIHCSSQVILPSVKTLILHKIKYLSERAFCNFSRTFPSIVNFYTSDNAPLVPKFILSALDSSLQAFDFLMDLNPETKSYEYGILIKKLLPAGLFKYIPEDYFSKPDDFPDSRFHLLELLKTYKENGTYDLELTSKNSFLPWNFFGLKQVEKSKPLEVKTMVFLYILFLAVFLSIGAFGNLISGYVLMQKKSRMSSDLVLLSLTIYDSVVILTYSMNSFFNVNLFYKVFVKSSVEYDNQSESQWFKSSALSGTYTPTEHAWMSHKDWLQAYFTYPLNKIAYTGSVYSIVIISVERFIAISIPLKSKFLLSSRNLKMAILAVFLFSVFLNMPRWIETYEWDFYSATSLSWNEYYKPTFMRMEAYKLIYHGVIWTITMYVLPFVLVGILNFKLSRNIVQANRDRATMRIAAENNEEDSSVTKMLLCVVALFVICNSIHIAIVFYFFMAHDQIELSTIEAISCLPLIVNSSVNFIIYIVMGKTLRKEFIKIIPRCVRSRFNDKTETTQFEMSRSGNTSYPTPTSVNG